MAGTGTARPVAPTPQQRRSGDRCGGQVQPVPAVAVRSPRIGL